MFRPMLRAGLAPAALFTALAWTAHAAAKPPELPIMDKDVLAPASLLVPVEASRPAPNPFPQVAEPHAAPMMEMPSLFTMRPSARRMVASCLLFGAHPLLALAPTEDYLNFDDDDVQGVAPVAFLAPVTSEAPTGSLLIGVGVNADAGLTGTLEVNADMPTQASWADVLTACWRLLPQVFGGTEEEHASGFHLVQPAIFETEGPATLTPEPIREAPKEFAPMSPDASGCPYLQQLQCPSNQRSLPFTEADLCPDVLRNLEMLHHSQTLLQKARELGGEGRVVEAMHCLDLAHDLCPGARFDAVLQEAAVELFAPCFCGSPNGAVGGDELPAPPAEKASEKKPAEPMKPFNTSRSTGREREIEMKLAEPATVIFNSEPLHQVIDDLRSWQNLNICVDKAALDAEEISLDKLITVKVENVPLKSALTSILNQAHLTYVVNEAVLQVTTERGARGKSVCVPYVVGDLLDEDLAIPTMSAQAEKQPASDTLIQLITQAIEPRDWSDAGGKGTITFNPDSHTLLIDQTADVQEQVADLLGALRRSDDTPVENRQVFDNCAPIRPQVARNRTADMSRAKVLMQKCVVAMEAGRLPEAIILAERACDLNPLEAVSPPEGSQSVAPLAPSLPPVDPGTPAALDQLFYESAYAGVAEDTEEQTPGGVAKPFQKADDLDAVGCGKDAGSPMSCIDVFSDFAAATHPGFAEFGLGLDGSMQMFTQFHRGGAVWHVRYNNGSLSVWASPDGGADVEKPANANPSD